MNNMNLGQPILQRRLDECPANTYICRQADSNNGGTCCPLNDVCCQDGCCPQGYACAVISGGQGCTTTSPQTMASTSDKTTSTTSSLSSTTWETITTSAASINTASVPQSNKGIARTQRG